MHTTSTTKIKTSYVLAVAGIGLALSLTACSGGSGLDGTYYIEEVNGTSDLGQLVVDGGTVAHHEYSCDGVYEEPDVTSTGELNTGESQVVWTVAGGDRRNERTGTEAFTISDSSITVGGDVYVRDDSDAGRALLKAFEAGCAE